jgi:nuclear GTP-binding protein
MQVCAKHSVPLYLVLLVTFLRAVFVCLFHYTELQSKPGPDTEMASEPTISTLAADAALLDSSLQASTSYATQELNADGSSSDARPIEQARRHYVRQLHKVIEEADIICLVLDARDPEGCRSRLVEEEVRRREHEGKRLIFVLNKIGWWLLLPAAGYMLTIE